MHFRRFARTIDRDSLLDRIDQPRKLRPICNPPLHLLFEFSQIIARRTKFNHKVRAERDKALPVAITESLPAATLDPGCIRAEHGAVRQGKSSVRFEDNASIMLAIPQA